MCEFVLGAGRPRAQDWQVRFKSLVRNHAWPGIGSLWSAYIREKCKRWCGFGWCSLSVDQGGAVTISVVPWRCEARRFVKGSRITGNRDGYVE